MVLGEIPRRVYFISAYRNKDSRLLSTMNIKTELGRLSLRMEREAIDRFIELNPDYSFMETPKGRYAALDGTLCADGEIRGVVEVKTRNMTRAKMRDVFKDTWLLSMDKLEAGKAASMILQVPFVGILYLLPEKITLMLTITDERGNWLFDFEKKKTITMENVNGGEVERLNAFLPLKTAKEYT